MSGFGNRPAANMAAGGRRVSPKTPPSRFRQQSTMDFVKEKGLKASSLFQTMNFSPFGPPPAANAPAPTEPAKRRGRLSGAQNALRGR